MVGYMSFHKATRRQFDLFLAQIARANWHNEEEVKSVQNKFGFYWEMLEHHHLSEDHGLFPMLAGIDPNFAAALDKLTADHQTLDYLVALIQDDLRQLVENQNRAIAKSYWQQLCTRTENFKELMTGHLDREEEVVIPAISGHFTVEQQIAIEARIVNQMGSTHLAKTIPWMYEVLDEEEKASITRVCPNNSKPSWKYGKRYPANDIRAAV